MPSPPDRSPIPLPAPGRRVHAVSLLCLAWASACGGGGSDAGEVTASGELSLLTYNVAGLPALLSGSEPDLNTPMISPLLNAYDLVLVQEDWLAPDPNPVPAFEVYHALLAADAEHPYQSQPAELPLGEDPARPEAQFADGLNRFSDSPFAGLTRVGWEGCFGGIDTSDGGAGDCLAQKGFSMAVHDLAEGVEVHVYNLHGEAGGTDTDQALQVTGYSQLGDFIEDHSAGAAILLAGDTNLHTDDDHPDGDGDGDAEIWAAFRARTGLTDACDAVDDCPRGIDKMAFRGDDGVSFEVVSARHERDRFSRPDGADLSDHPPLHVQLHWEARR